jgi:mevalonate kinase
MPAFSASAPGKVILFGEHAVVYGRPALAVPVTQVKAKVSITANPKGRAGDIRLLALDIQLDTHLGDLDPRHPLAAAIQKVAAALEVKRLPACTIKITSTIPVAAGLGSGAAVSVAVIRAFAAFLGGPLPDDEVCRTAFEIEKIHHGTPSGIDNTVVTYARPVYFIKGQPVETFPVGRPFTLVIGDTGIASPTSATVGDVRKAWENDPTHFEALFDSTGAIAQSARVAVENGAIELLGPLMDANHGLLRKMGVSCNELDVLVNAARGAGAWGAKLSGGGRGGNMIALAAPDRAEKISQALRSAGAVRTVITQVGG